MAFKFLGFAADEVRIEVAGCCFEPGGDPIAGPLFAVMRRRRCSVVALTRTSRTVGKLPRCKGFARMTPWSSSLILSPPTTP
ncbi:MAG: hypothetical protein ACJAXA_003245, partial [Candidatus Aldehydirespiratoraceae bacterium]